MKTHKEESTMIKVFLRPTLIGLLIGIVSCLLVLLVLAAAAASFDIPPAAVVPLAIVATAVGAFAGGFGAAKAAGRNGWLVGGITAVLLFVVSLLSGLGLFQNIDGSFVLIKALVMLACGLVGGVLAVNSGKKKKR